MWTPKRIVMLAGCFLAFFTAYIGYAASAVGRIDGLPPLPEPFWPPDPSGENTEMVMPKGPSMLTRKIIQAFGPGARELKEPIRLDLQSRNMVLCAGQFKLNHNDGRVILEPISVGMFGKPKKDGAPPEVSTLRGEVAYLTFDQPVQSFSEIGHRKLVEAEIHSRIEVTNNRHREERDQDLRMSVPTGPLYYRESTHRIWTNDYVTLTDYKSKPKPHVIKGKGMEMELHAEAEGNDAKPQTRRSSKDSINGINWVVLHSNVEMNLYVDGKNGLISSTQPDQPAPRPDAKGKQPSQAHLHITTPGQFRYDVEKDHDVANFDVAPAGLAQPSRQPQHVDVIRYTDKGTDHLVCQHLTLGLKRKDDKSGEKAPALDAKNSEGTEIETVHATSPKCDVVLTSDAEHLIAKGNDFFHDAVKGLTILKGDPEMEVEKEDSMIYARELHIQDVKPPRVPGKPPEKPYQNISAKGPGRIHMVDKGEREESKPRPSGPAKKEKKIIHAYWQDMLTSVKLTAEKDKGLDLLTLTGDARFVDEEAGQSLKADKIKVWLEAVARNLSSPAGAQKAQGSPAGDKGGTDAASGRRPKHLEATGHVVTRSRDLNIHDTDRLVVWFKDVPATHLPPGNKPAQPAAAKKPAPPGPPRGNRPMTALNEQKPPVAQAMPRGPETAQPVAGGTPQGEIQNPASGPQLPGQKTEQQPRPFDLAASRVEAKVLRAAAGGDGAPSKSSIDELWCEGSVEVHQEAANPGDKPTEIKGDTLKMTARGDDLYYLVVTGDLGSLQTDKILIMGPEVNIDQSTNKAWVDGDGFMTMESATNLQGEKLEKAQPLTVHWSKSMFFNGMSAEYHGNIQAEQNNAHLACKRMHVFFDRTISLRREAGRAPREGAKGEEAAKVRELVCDQDVHIEDITKEGDRVVKYFLLISPGVQMTALDPDEEPNRADPPARGTGKKDEGKPSGGNVIHASGAGSCRSCEMGDSNTTGPTFGPKPAAERKPGDKDAPAKPAAAPNKSSTELKLTYVEFGKRMDANSKTNVAIFWENVRVLNLPCEKYDMPINLDAMLAADLPERAVYLRCDWLKVLDQPVDGSANKTDGQGKGADNKEARSRGQTNKQMEAHGKVYVQGRDGPAREFYAYADVVTYNQQKEQVIFYGGNGNASLYKVERRGEAPSYVEGKKIIYNRSTGETKVIEGNNISGSTGPLAPAGPAKPTKPDKKEPAKPGQRGSTSSTPYSR